METATVASNGKRERTAAARTFPTLTELIAAEKKDGSSPTFPSLDRETRAAVETACAAYHLNRQPQTLRCWAVYESGPIRAFRVHGRLMWPTAKLRELCKVAP